MKAWCDHCNKYVEYTREITHTEELESKGVKFNVLQTYGICPVCDEEVLSNALADRNIQKAHNAYRRALDSITSEEIQGILVMYNIGAQPLSLLLGWGANTIERQMKHTIPSKEHAKQLRRLLDPSVMYRLLENNKDKISRIAYEKALKAVFEHLEFDVRRQEDYLPFQGSLSNLDPSSIIQIFKLAKVLPRIKSLQYCEEYRPSNAQYQLAFSRR